MTARRPASLILAAVLLGAGCTGDIGGFGGLGSDGGSVGDDDDDDDGGTPAGPDASVPTGVGAGAAVERGGDFFGTTERFNRYYTDPDWQPARLVFVSPNGGGNGASAASPTTLAGAVALLEPGTRVELASGTYDACIDLDDSHSGTYDAPVVFAGERNGDGSLGVRLDCCDTGRRACFNLEATNYVAFDGLELVGGRYGVRAVGAGFPADQHQVGVAILSSHGHDQAADPFFSGQSDWYVIEGVTANGAGAADGHGIYLSNGSDWLIVRGNELYGNASADFQINADPYFTCAEDGIAFEDAECEAIAGTHPTGGRGATDFALVERNFFHDGLAQGPNFTSVRNSLVRNNVIAFYAQHGASFWQETTNPDLGSRNNRVLHNLFISTNNRHAVQFVAHSTENVFAQNVLLGVTLGGSVAGNANALLMEVDDTVLANVYTRNAYVSGRLEGRVPGADELRSVPLDAAWFAGFPTSLQHLLTGFAPDSGAPWIQAGQVLSDSPADMHGETRKTPTALGPIER